MVKWKLETHFVPMRSWPVCTDLNNHFCCNWETHAAHILSSLRLALCLMFIALLCSVWYSNETSGGLCIALVKPLNCSNLARLFLLLSSIIWIQLSANIKFFTQFDAKIDNISLLQAQLIDICYGLKIWAVRECIRHRSACVQKIGTFNTLICMITLSVILHVLLKSSQTRCTNVILLCVDTVLFFLLVQ